MPIFFAETKAHEHASHMSLDGVSIAGAEFVLDALVAFRHLRILWRRMVELRHASGQVFHLLLHLAQLGKNRHALGEYGAAGEREPVLRQVASADPLCRAERSVIERLDPRENLHQRGFPRAIRAYQPNAVARRNHPVSSLKEELVTVAFSGRGKLNHGVESIVS